MAATEAAPSEDFDLATVIAPYSGYGKINRLMFISGVVTGAKRIEALRLAAQEVQSATMNVTQYRSIIKELAHCGASGVVEDTAWVEAAEKRNAAELSRLISTLTTARSNLVKDTIRATYMELGHHYYALGNFTEARRSFVATSQFRTNESHGFERDIFVLRVDMAATNFASITQTAQAARKYSVDSRSPVALTARLQTLAGLGNLVNRSYKAAASLLLEVNGADYISGPCDEISPQDVAAYAVLAAVASFDRDELKRKLVNNATFRPILELQPGLREAVSDFLASRYASCIAHLAAIHQRLLLDPFVLPVVSTLMTEIRNRAYVQYFSPFVSVDLTRMAEAFSTPVATLESDLASLIGAGVIQARIDSHQKILFARQADERAQAYERALAVGDAYQQSARAMLLRVSLMRSHFVLRPTYGLRARGGDRGGDRDRDRPDRFAAGPQERPNSR
eukprot:c16308_g1_i2.p1 GENE.c16308_g1_i2~~c16308_g1_i2.p1  ORF type:complete len:452 (-),score=84.68 c16308_g1_i2:511-1866(-)